MCICYYSATLCPCTDRRCEHTASARLQRLHGSSTGVRHIWWALCMRRQIEPASQEPWILSADTRTGGRMPNCPLERWTFVRMLPSPSQSGSLMCYVCTRHHRARQMRLRREARETRMRREAQRSREALQIHICVGSRVQRSPSPYSE